ncbi:esterase-like activity of phytase family protein [Fibrisoma montanum]|uniref:Esterase-like activity of phytase family protein n=1 Tax=Fibrisoma montanum TaxID=2305895 RepID=A0A418MF09_9BACT|nr:esterase-like activity of phytase family protein [Fibrisoma montanum]RIV25388.1 esterase-like activity of phytase family protein [Fibrisoma montanum]
MKLILSSTIALGLLAGIVACEDHRTNPGSPQTVSGLRFIGERIVPFQSQFGGTSIGGLSSIDYRAETNQFYIMADDQGTTNPVRYYTASLNYTANAFNSVNFTGVTTLKNTDGSNFTPARVDPEGLQFDAVNRRIIWSSEGLRNPTATPAPIFIQPFIREANLDGSYVADYPVPSLFNIQPTENGTRSNGSFEGLALTVDGRYLFAASEEPLYEDGPRAAFNVAGSPIRIIKYDRQTGQPVAQYAYRLDAVHAAPQPSNQFQLNGVVDMIALSETQLLVMERSFAVGATPDYSVKIYRIDLTNATNIANVNGLQGANYTPATKTLLYDVATSGVSRIDNLEGMTLGPKLPNGNYSLVMVSDDNFGAAQITQFLAFEVLP